MFIFEDSEICTVVIAGGGGVGGGKMIHLSPCKNFREINAPSWPQQLRRRPVREITIIFTPCLCVGVGKLRPLKMKN